MLVEAIPERAGLAWSEKHPGRSLFDFGGLVRALLIPQGPARSATPTSFLPSLAMPPPKSDGNQPALANGARLAALDSFGLLDTSAEAALDSLAKLAAQICDVPIALVTLVDDVRQFFKAQEGFDGPVYAPLDVGYCPIVVKHAAPVVIPDTQANPIHAANAAARDGGIRFYAGVPLQTQEGQVLGTLCVLDKVPRPQGLSETQLQSLEALAIQVMSQFELRRSLAQQKDLLAEQQVVIRERAALSRVQAAISVSNGEIGPILQALVEAALDAVPAAEAGVLELIDGDMLEYRAVAGTVSPHKGLRVPLLGSLAGHCAMTRTPILVDDILSDSRTTHDIVRRIGLRAAVIAPVARGDQVLGVVKLQSSRPGAFTQRDLQVVRLFAGEASAGLTEVGAVQAQRAAAAAAQRHRSIFDSTTQFAIIVTDRDGRVTDWNSGAERILGWSAKEMHGQTVERVFTPEDRANGRVATEMRLSSEQGRASDERWHSKKDGSRFWASGEMMPLLDQQGAHVGYIKVLRDRTSEHTAGQALADAETGLRRAQEAGGVGLFSVNLSDNQLYPTPEFCRLYGLPVQDSYPAATIEALVLPEDAHLVSTATSRMRGEHIGDVEYRVRLPSSGVVRWIARKGEMERDEVGRPVRFSGVARDVTAQHEAGKALALSEDRFSAILKSIEAAFAIVQVKFDADDQPVDYRFVEANPAFERQAGVNLRGKWVTEFAPDLERFWFNTYGHVAQTGEPANFESYAKAFGRWFDVRAVRIGEPAERQIAIFFSDTTERREAEERLRASEAVARENVERVQLALAAGAIIGTWSWDLPTDRFTVDEAFARAFGLDPALGRAGIPLAQIVATVHPDDQEGLTAAINKAIARGGNYAHQYRTRRADGNYYWLEANGHVTHAPDGTPQSFPGVLIDVEERRAIEAERERATSLLRNLNETLEQRVADRTAELMQAEEQLRQAQKMEAVGQLTGGLAHDFNNLLAGIVGSLDLLQRRIKQGRTADIEKYVTGAMTAANRAAALTHRLLAFSRRQTLDPKVVDANALVAGIEELLCRTAGPAISVETVLPADVGPILCDPNQLENVLLNLAINARDAMPDGGSLRIETRQVEVDALFAGERDMPQGAYVTLAVTDTGTGMPPEVIARAFDPFFTTKPLGEGTGPRPQHDLRFRQAVGRAGAHPQQGGDRHHRDGVPAALRRRGRRKTAGGDRRRGRGRNGRNGAGGRRRAARARVDRRGARGTRLSCGRGDGRRVRHAPDRAAPALRPHRHRCRHARRHERAAARRCRPPASPRPRRALHYGIRGIHRRRERRARTWHAGVDQTIHDGSLSRPHPQHDRRQDG